MEETICNGPIRESVLKKLIIPTFLQCLSSAKNFYSILQDADEKTETQRSVNLLKITRLQMANSGLKCEASNTDALLFEEKEKEKF